MRIFMTGGTGMIGRHLLDQFRGRDDEVTIVSRSADAARRSPRYQGIRVISGDTSRAGPWQDEVDGSDVVVNLAGHNVFAERWSVSVRAAIRDSRVCGTENLVTAVRAARSRPVVFVQGSAIGYYGPSDDEPLTETAPSGRDLLAVVCRESEEAALPVSSVGVRLAVIRTGVVLGRDEGALGIMAPIFRWGGAAPVGSGGNPLGPGRGRQWISWIHLDDIVGIFLQAIDHQGAVGPINGTAPEPARNIDFSRSLARVVHRPFLPIGPPDVLLAVLLGGVAGTITSGQRVLPTRALELGYSFQHPVLNEAIRSVLSS